MTKDEDFKLLKIQTCILRVNLHCDGCKHKVKKLLQKIEGVYQVSIDAEQQKVTVSGSVDSTTLVKKLVRAGKHAEIWSNKSNHKQHQSQNHQNQKGSCIKDDKKNKTQKQDFIKGLESLKNQQKVQPLTSEDDDDYFDDDEEDDEEELRFLREKTKQLALLRQQQQQLQQQQAAAMAANKGRNSNSQSQPNNGNVKKGSQNQNMGVKRANNNNNTHMGGNVNMNLGEGKRVNDMSSMMNNLAGLHGNGGVGNLGGFQMPQNTHIQGSGAAGFHLPNGGLAGHNPSSQAAMVMNMNGPGYNNQQQQYNNNAAAASMMMNMHNRQAMNQQPQPQLMYQRSPIIPPSTGYYYNYNSAPYIYNDPPHNYYYYNGGGGDSSSAHMFSDENASSCSIM